MDQVQLLSILGVWGSIGSVWSSWVWPIIQFLLGLGLVVFIHELGHFAVAKWSGIKVERFALGMGPRLVGFKKGETDYCICALPLGGYVKMLGQEDFAPNEEQADPRAFNNKSVGKRFAVISAGVIMNIILATILLTTLGVIGMDVPAPVIGEVRPDLPAARASIDWQRPEGLGEDVEAPPATGLRPGDTVLRAQGDSWALAMIGQDVTRFDRLPILAMLASPDQTYDLTIRREHEGRVWEGVATLGVQRLDEREGNHLAFGIMPAQSLEIFPLPDARSPLQEGDRLVAVDGQRVRNSWELPGLLRQLRPGSIELTVLREQEEVTITRAPAIRMIGRVGTTDYPVWLLPDGRRVLGRGVYDTQGKLEAIAVPGEQSDVRISSPDAVRGTHDLLLDVLGMTPRLRVESVTEGSPAGRAGMQPGDVILSYADRTSPTLGQVNRISESLTEATRIVVRRDGERVSMEVRPYRQNGRMILGFMPGLDLDHPVVAHVRPGSVAQEAGIMPGMRIRAVNGRPVENWYDVVAILGESMGQELHVAFADGGDSIQLAALTPEMHDPSLYVMDIFPVEMLGQLEVRDQQDGLLAAAGWGFRETGYFAVVTYATVRRLIQGFVPTHSIHGPVGITSLAVTVGRTNSLAMFIWFWSMISVSLAVVNFLPLPVLDGGHAVFLLIEKIRGKPVPQKVLNYAQMAGLAMLLLLFVTLTWNDISRIVSG